MAPKIKGNNYVVDEENGIARMELQRKNDESVWALIDLDDLERVKNFPYTWSAKYDPALDKYYVESTMYCVGEDGKKHGKCVKLHKFIMNVEGTEVVVDHINHDTLDNRKENLRNIPWHKNSINRKSRNSNNRSGYRNVAWISSENAWVVQLSINGKNTRLGKFPPDKVDEAGAFAEEMRQKYYGEFAGAS